MAEAFQLAESILDVMEIAKNVIVACYKYQGRARSFSKKSQKIRDRLMGLRTALGALQQLGAEGRCSEGVLSSCAAEMERLQRQLEPKAGLKGKCEVLKWCLSEKKTLGQLECTIRTVLAIDQIKLMMNIRDDIVNIRDALELKMTTAELRCDVE